MSHLSRPTRGGCWLRCDLAQPEAVYPTKAETSFQGSFWASEIRSPLGRPRKVSAVQGPGGGRGETGIHTGSVQFLLCSLSHTCGLHLPSLVIVAGPSGSFSRRKGTCRPCHVCCRVSALGNRSPRQDLRELHR